MHTISIRFANKKERDAMWGFLQSFTWNTLHNTEQGGESVWKIGEDVGYPISVGRNLIAARTHDVPQWMWAVAAWMAQRSSYRIHNWGVVHHDAEEIPVVVGDKHMGNDVLVLTEDLKLLSWRDRELPKGPDHQQQIDFVEQMNTVWNSLSVKPTKR